MPHTLLAPPAVRVSPVRRPGKPPGRSRDRCGRLGQAPDAETAHKVSVISRAEGAVSAESWQAMPYDDFIRLLQEVEP